MTISTTTARTTYNGNGITTVFSIPFRFLANGDIVVVEVSSAGVETTKALTTNYTLNGAGDDSGGSVNMLVAPAVGTRLIIYRDTDIVQETDYISGDPFPAETHERALDRLTRIAQEIGSDADRAIKVPVGDSSSLSTTLPAAADRAGKFFAFDVNGVAVAVTGSAGGYPVSSYMGPFLTSSSSKAAHEFLTYPGSFVVESIAALRAVGKITDNSVFVTGYYAAGDGGGGAYRYDASDVISTDDGCRVIVGADGGRWKLTQTFPTSFKQWGAKGDGTTDDTARIQAALDYLTGPGGEVWVDQASTFKVTGTLLWGNGTCITGSGTDSLIKGASLTVPIFQSKGTSLTRRYRLQLRNLAIDNTTKTALGGIGCDLRNATDCSLQNVAFSNVDTGVQHLADGGLGCYYNTLSECVFSNCNIGAIYTTLANENRNIACRFNNTTTGILASDGSHNHFISPSIEIFTSIGIHVSGPAYDTQIISPRLENLPTSGIGIKVVAAAVRTSIKDPQYVSLTTNLDDAGVGTTTNGRQRVTAVIDFASIPAGSVLDQFVSITNALATDSVNVTPPSTLVGGLVCTGVPGAGGHYVRMANVTGVAIDPASATFTIDIWRRD